MHHANINQKKARVQILISNKIDLRAMKITRDRQELCLIKGLIHQESLTKSSKFSLFLFSSAIINARIAYHK